MPKAIVIDQGTHAVALRDVPMATEPPSGSVHVRPLWFGICRSDTELLDGDFDSWAPVNYPIVPGHEWVGVVTAVGPGSDRFSIGDRVVGECVTGHMSWFGLTYDGAGSEEFVVLERLLHDVPERISDRSAAMIEPFTVAYRALEEAGSIDASDTVVVIGGGMIGQCAALAAHAKGALTVLVEPSAQRREMATRLGVDATVDPSAPDAEATIAAVAGPLGVRVVIEASGNPHGMASAYRIVSHNGTIVQIGITAAAEVSAPLALIQAKDLTIKGITGSSGVWPRAIRFIERTGIDLTPLATDEFSFDEAAEAFDRSRDASSTLKVLIHP
ncbi:zinc-dependent alcohol dehydrogenase [Microbacterium schleiferi]|uniref:zinc-dependent alcohol dehydrogenase n=1 Tax=Microbacterium schleiferi TaxID=69362 RepID=UPI001D17C3B3|nr:zinc-binding dehydrogenase [Microbacterium schleiferi]MCC4266936.1 zinc-binding dehydrogenase [Microbacterium schleiferi]